MNLCHSFPPISPIQADLRHYYADIWLFFFYFLSFCFILSPLTSTSVQVFPTCLWCPSSADLCLPVAVSISPRTRPVGPDTPATSSAPVPPVPWSGRRIPPASAPTYAVAPAAYWSPPDTARDNIYLLVFHLILTRSQHWMLSHKNKSKMTCKMYLVLYLWHHIWSANCSLLMTTGIFFTVRFNLLTLVKKCIRCHKLTTN